MARGGALVAQVLPRASESRAKKGLFGSRSLLLLYERLNEIYL